mgnify:CR=1 FL=1
MTQAQFKVYLDSLPYDKYCQDIEYLNFIGHSKSHITWNLIKDFIDWKNKKVADLGCFHGYYCFKIEELGGQATGFDKAPIVLETARKLNNIYNKNVSFVEWSGGELISSYYDVSLLISVLYRFDNKEKSLDNIKSRYLICDIEPKEVYIIKNFYNILDKKESWGKETRRGIGEILFCERK